MSGCQYQRIAHLETPNEDQANHVHPLGFEADRYLNRVHETGNLAAASMPRVIDDAVRSGTIRRGDRLLLLGTSAGYSQAGLVFEY